MVVTDDWLLAIILWQDIKISLVYLIYTKPYIFFDKFSFYNLFKANLLCEWYKGKICHSFISPAWWSKFLFCDMNISVLTVKCFNNNNILFYLPLLSRPLSSRLYFTLFLISSAFTLLERLCVWTGVFEVNLLRLWPKPDTKPTVDQQVNEVKIIHEGGRVLIVK